MKINRRKILASMGLLGVSPLFWKWLPQLEAEEKAPSNEWEKIRSLFDLDWRYIHLAGLLLASHPKPVKDAIEKHRIALDKNPCDYHDNNDKFEDAVKNSAARYLGTDPSLIALTDSTTMGLALLYSGIDVNQDQEIIVTNHDHYATHESLRLLSLRTGAKYRRIALYDKINSISEEEIVDKMSRAINDKTRVVAVTWVHSSTGLKLPIRALADSISLKNRSRDEKNRILFCVDGVHGLGIENLDIKELGCDFFIAGTHKWLFGPRGTGILWGKKESWQHVTPIIPSFSGLHNKTISQIMTPGGYHSFEHRWALKEAFDLHMAIGKTKIEKRIRSLNQQMKEGLSKMKHVTLYTPMKDELSAGIIGFNVNHLKPKIVEKRLREQGIINKAGLYERVCARVCPGLLNTPQEIEMTLKAIRSL